MVLKTIAANGVELIEATLPEVPGVPAHYIVRIAASPETPYRGPDRQVAERAFRDAIIHVSELILVPGLGSA